jgi:hypothetical protein
MKEARPEGPPEGAHPHGLLLIIATPKGKHAEGKEPRSMPKRPRTQRHEKAREARR